MQPWTFTVIRSPQTRSRVHELYLRERQAAACFYDEPRRSEFLALKLEGIREAPVNICVSCDPTRGGTHVLGRNSQPETDVYSTCCAVQNLWLAARAEGLGVGWVSILKTGELREILAIPPHVVPSPTSAWLAAAAAGAADARGGGLARAPADGRRGPPRALRRHPGAGIRGVRDGGRGRG